MENKIGIGILEFGLTDSAKNLSNDLECILKNIKKIEQWGYNRFWIGEHHEHNSICSSPEILIPILAAQTKSIKIGTAGVLLKFYSPLKIAKNYKLLSTIFPNRIELGIAFGGALPNVEEAMACENKETLDGKLKVLVDYLNPLNQINNKDVPVTPLTGVPTEILILGSSLKAIERSNQAGKKIAYGLLFGNSTNNNSTDILKNIKTELILVLGVSCSSTMEKAKKEYLKFDKKGKGTLHANIIGDPLFCSIEILRYANMYNTKQIVVTFLSNEYEKRIMSAELLSQYLPINNQTKNLK